MGAGLRTSLRWIGLCGICILLGMLVDRWVLDVPFNAYGRFGQTKNKLATPERPDLHEHIEGDGHDHGSQSNESSIVVSELALKNLGLSKDSLKPIELSQYQRSISVPGMISERPGRTRIPVSAAMTGIITSVLIAPGEAVKPNTPFIKLKLTHEDLVTLQTDYLQTLGKLDVEEKEIVRLSSISESGAVSPKSLLERQYNRDILRSSLDAQRESLRLHGIDREQLSYIDRERKLLTELTILTPSAGNQTNSNIFSSSIFESNLFANTQDTQVHFVSSPLNSIGIGNVQDELLILQSLQVQLGQLVSAGDILGVFADYSTLLIEGQAFESDLRSVLAAKNNNWPVQARLADDSDVASIGEFPIGWIENEIDPTKRIVKFFTVIPNASDASDSQRSETRFIEWQYRPGQRVQISVPVERWDEQFVLPTEAVTRDGISSYVFIQNGESFDRVEVNERFRDTKNVVIENDGAIYPGDIVALKGAHQLQLALKNRSGGGVDPHAGHSH